jgi:hypothetical protein
VPRAEQSVTPDAATNEFPAGWEGFHTYAEMTAYVKTVADAHPAIAHRFSIGQSYQGRQLWAVKVSDNVNVDENEPEVLFDGLHHAREHMSLEMTLQIYNWLVNGYGKDSEVTRLVNSREIWIVFAVNPDGGEYDISGGKYHLWRKNRQPTPGSSYIGTDLNRNYDYHWGCCGGASTNPANLMYRGPKPFSAPETRAVRDFINSRVVGGRQQIRVAITFHTSGRLVMWPYGYTYANVPPDMTSLDQKTFVAMGKAMASRNGYKAEQSSDLYITDGDQIDWLYGVHRIFSFTWELWPPETSTVWGDHYPADENIATQTARNRSALLYFLDIAGCPYRAVGREATHCGPYNDDLEIDRGWTHDPYGTDTATAGTWAPRDPEATSTSGTPIQLASAYSGLRAMVTGGQANGSASANDLDGGTTTIRSAPIALPATVGSLTFRYYFAHGTRSDRNDAFRVYVESGGTKTQVFREYGTAFVDGAKWAKGGTPLTAWAGKTVRIVFEATDGGPDTLIEAGVDDVHVEQP